MLAARPGVAWWVAVLIAFVPTVIGVVVDLSVNNDIGVIAWVLTLLGVTLAALAVRRHALFTVMVQPPLVVLAALVIGYVIATLTGGITGGVLNLGLKLVGTFPLMLVATAVAAILGVVRLVAQPLRTVSPRRTTGSPSHL